MRSLILFIMIALPMAVSGSTYNFSSAPSGGTLYGYATITSGVLRLTPNSNSKWGVYKFDPDLSSAPTSWTIQFDHRQWGGNGADGMSFHFGPTQSSWTDYRSYDDYYILNGLSVQYDDYGNRTKVYWNGELLQSVYRSNFNTEETITIHYDENGLDYSGPGISFTNRALSNYNSIVNSNWVLTFAARTGGLNNYHDVDDLVIDLADTTPPTISTEPTIVHAAKPKAAIATLRSTVNRLVPEYTTAVRPPAVSRVRGHRYPNRSSQVKAATKAATTTTNRIEAAYT